MTNGKTTSDGRRSSGSGLEAYERKRDFARTPEPRAGRARRRGNLRYVIQKHAARTLHYDLRLEHDGVLKSWAVPKGPSSAPGVRRLAVETEDHPLDYASFEGEIPRGQHGAGSVMIWDRGYWRPHGDAARGLAAGKLDFEIHGDRLRGRFVLVRLGRRDGRARPSEWLLMRQGKRSGGAKEGGPASAGAGTKTAGGVAAAATADHTAPTTADLAATPPADLPDARRADLPRFVPPQLATAVRSPPEGPGWFFEPKLDGFRILCRRGSRGTTLLTRSGLDWTKRLPGVAEAVASLPCESALIDGEAVVFGRRGVTDFQRLQNAIARGDRRIVLVAFDLLHLDGYDLHDVVLEQRKALLKRLLAAPPAAIRYGEHVDGTGAEVLGEACRLGLEGIVAKRAGDAYRSGRSRSWQKIKCAQRQEFVVAGFTEPGGTREGFGALLLATRRRAGAPLDYVGKVGTGFDARMLQEIRGRLEPLLRGDAPVTGTPPRIAREARWVEPALVAEIEFSEWTDDGRLRHARFKGLRDDKTAAEVIVERPAAQSDAKGNGAAAAVAGARRRGGAKQPVRLTHPNKVLFPDDGITKSELADYWRAVADYALPLFRHRPLMLLRCPDGHGAHCFRQKHVGISMPESVPRVAVSPDEEPYGMVDSLPALLGLVQIAALELHAWGSRADRLDQPDVIVFDLDPDEGLAWDAVAAAALELKGRIEALGLAAFARVTGGKGLHVVIPVVPGPRWPAVKKFARAMADEMVRAAPRQFTASSAKRRRRGRIFIDYLRNARGATAIATYSPRARAGAPVALPVGWDSLESPGAGPPKFGLREVPALLAARADPWAGFESARRPLVD